MKPVPQIYYIKDAHHDWHDPKYQEWIMRQLHKEGLRFSTRKGVCYAWGHPSFPVLGCRTTYSRYDPQDARCFFENAVSTSAWEDSLRTSLLSCIGTKLAEYAETKLKVHS